MEIPGQIEAHVGKLRLVLRLLGDRLIELRLVDHRIDFAENIALLDLLPLGEVYGNQFAIDLRANQNIVQRTNRTDALEIDRHILNARRRRQHRDGEIGTRPVGCLLLLLKRRPSDIAEAAKDQQRDENRNCTAARARRHAGNAAARCFRGFIQIRLKEH